MASPVREGLETLQDALRSFSAHGGRVLGAATAFYGLLAAAPLLLMGLVVTGVLTDEDRARAQVLRDLGVFIGEDSSKLLSQILDNLSESRSGPVAATVSVVLLLWAGMRLFTQLRYSLNHLWGFRERRTSGFSGGARKQLRRRAAALTMVILVVLIITATVLVKAALGRLVSMVGSEVPTRWHVLEVTVSFFTMTVAFFATFKVLPSVRIASRDALVGAIVTSVMFTIGAVLIGIYLGFKSTDSTYGAAGSVVALLLWTYYSAQVFFIGAAFTRAFAERHGRGIVATEFAVRIVEDPSSTGPLAVEIEKAATRPAAPDEPSEPVATPLDAADEPSVDPG